MKIHRFIGNFDLTGREVSSTDRELINQLKNVLRLSPGDRVQLSSGEGTEADATIDTIKSGKVLFSLIGRTQEGIRPSRIVSLYCSILKRENFELVAQKATECGVSGIVPMICERTIKTGLNFDRLEKIVREASEQCGRGTVPTVSPICDWETALGLAGEARQKKILFDRLGDEIPLDLAGPVGIFIGPEGGWTEREIQLARKNDCQIASLGNLTLRGETAAIIASYLTVHG
ncbi:MAG: RsmE family RNA methyltransferase [Candidatus Vogelbacteria bacterium]|nr:RsmE family RNA methyltransferase [Candidatus Vogelbacteria bacterium]